MTKKIGLLVIATGRYRQFLDGLLESATRFFMPQHQVTRFIFSDSAADFAHTVRIPVKHAKWPHMTLNRYHLFAQHAPLLQSMDYLFYVDVDMKFASFCGDEILPATVDRLTGVEHPAFFRRTSTAARALHAVSGGRWGSRRLDYPELPFEKNPLSLACVPWAKDATYYAGGFNGGFTDSFLSMASGLRDAIDHDRSRNMVAIWHDESHLNRYFWLRKPKRLSPAYCYPESGYPHLRGIQPVVIALDKDHAYFREDAARV
jgi:hypothetical protein